MGIEERKAREKERRKRMIIDAAEEVIFEKGIDQATMEEIAEEAELSKGTLYLYFKNKNELYLALCERGSNILNDRFSKIFAEDRTGLELVRLMGETYLDFVRNNPDYFKAFMYYESLLDVEELRNSEMAQVCEENAQQAMQYIVKALQVGMQDGTIDDEYDPKELAIMIWGSTRGMVLLHHIKQKGHHLKVLDEMDINFESLFKNFLNLIGRGITPPKKMTTSQN
ncbi:MAG: TetR/AcrR family transcriptional regulator [Balneolaceae bacterium]|nr:TetR/AcrR family transcriptional regulator [Balneolaceae bacterium]